MKPVSRLTAAIALSAALLPAVRANALPAKACDTVSYWQTADGRCFDLSSFTALGSILSKQATVDRLSNPVIIQSLRVKRDSTLNLSFLKGSAVNTSSRTIRGFEVTANVSRMIDGNKTLLTSVSIPVPGTLPPNGVAAISWSVESPYLPSDAIVDVISVETY